MILWKKEIQNGWSSSCQIKPYTAYLGLRGCSTAMSVSAEEENPFLIQFFIKIASIRPRKLNFLSLSWRYICESVHTVEHSKFEVTRFTVGWRFRSTGCDLKNILYIKISSLPTCSQYFRDANFSKDKKSIFSSSRTATSP